MRATLLVLSAAAIWGSSFVAIKLSLESAPPVTSLLLRFLIAAAASTLALRALGPVRVAAFKDPLVIAIAAANAVGFVFQYIGIADTNSAVAAVLANIGVVVVAVLSALYLKERISGRMALAVLFAFAGASLLATQGDLSTTGGTEFRAAVLIAVASVIWSVFVVLNKVALGRGAHSEAEITWAVLALTALITLPFAVALEGLPTLAYTPVAWGAIAYAGVFCSSLSYVIYMMGLKELTATATAVLTVAEILVAFALTALVFGEVGGVVAAVGAALVLGGIMLASLRDRGGGKGAPAPPHAREEP